MDMIENTLLDDVKFDHNIMKKYSKYAEKFIKDLMNKNTFERPNKDPKVNAISKRIKFAKSLS